ncbi:mast cell protease 4-like [Nematolebias whitei]|uniref:mast cell protease 4-like n=1 Tax=Nematolebias whitei TaxID=451745 RepID=UPI00189B821F|nr:mast cell protease 4-like [Nematolebias whitei]
MKQTSCFIYALLLVTITGATKSGIVGGKVAEKHSRPYMASIQVDGQHLCGGILIRKDFVLTAAHCKDCYRDMTVVLGAHDISQKEKSQQTLNVKKYHVHPKFNKKFDYDIMLLELEKKAKLNKYVKLLGLVEKDEKIPTNVYCAVAGWGNTGPTESSSNLLKEATEKIQSISECKSIWKEHFISQHMICTTFNKKEGGVCQGDSGGPLICNTKLQGITAYTAENACDDQKYPHVFTKVHFFLPWIKTVMRK